MSITRTRVVVDIETVGCDWGSLTPEEHVALLRKAEDAAQERHIRESLALSPLTGEIIIVGMFNPETDYGRIYYRMPPISECEDGRRATELGSEARTATHNRVEFIRKDDELAIIRAFWDDLTHYRQFVTFNGRRFDGPFLMLRSLMGGIPIGRELVPNRYHDEHLDLCDRLSCFGMTTTCSLDFWCRRLGILSPKGSVSGHDVERLWREGKIEQLCVYNVADLFATAELLKRCEFVNLVCGPRNARP